MTILRVSLVGCPLDADAKRALATSLIDGFAEIEVGRTGPAIRRGFLVHFEEVAADDLYLGDAPMAQANETGRCAVVSVQVMAGPWNDAMKRALFEHVERTVRSATGMQRPDRGEDFWMTVVEVPEGGWGLGGRPVSIETLAPVFEDERQARIRTYLARRADA